MSLKYGDTRENRQAQKHQPIAFTEYSFGDYPITNLTTCSNMSKNAQAECNETCSIAEAPPLFEMKSQRPQQRVKSESLLSSSFERQGLRDEVSKNACERTRYNHPVDSQTSCQLSHRTARHRTVFLVIPFIFSCYN